MDESAVLRGLNEAREKVAIERQWNGESSSSNVAIYMNAYQYAEAYIRQLERRLAEYEHEHDWSNMYVGSSASPAFRKCSCGKMQVWADTTWRDLEPKSEAV